VSQVASNPSPAPALDALSPADATAGLSLAAARTASRNRPSFLVALGIIALAAGLIYALTGWLSHRDALAQAARAQTFANKILDASAQLKALQATEGSGGPRVGDQGNVLSRIEAAGTRAGLSKNVPVGNTTRNPNRETGWVQIGHQYNLKDPSLDAILRWMQFAVDDNPGLEVSQAVLRPEQSEWSMTVVFNRWEKPEGSP
jgi:hypothetical protein